MNNEVRYFIDPLEIIQRSQLIFSGLWPVWPLKYVSNADPYLLENIEPRFANLEEAIRIEKLNDLYRLKLRFNKEIRRAWIEAADKEVNRLHDKSIESMPLKKHEDCKLFRCLECWRYIFPDEEVEPRNDGYVHKVCNDITNRIRR